MDCIVVGYHETAASNDELTTLTSIDESPPAISNLLRTQLHVGGRSRSYLDALSYFRQSAHGEARPLYTVAELPNLGTIYLANYLRKHGHSAEIVNSFTYERSRLQELLEQDPVCVAVTTTFYMTPAPVVEIVETIRLHRPGVPIVVGGPLVDNYCRGLAGDRLGRVFDRMGADFYVWESQGEATLCALVGALRTGRSLADVPNVFACEGSSWTFSTRRPENNSLDDCVVDWPQFGIAELGTTLSTRTARSCAFKCAFCDYPARAGALRLADLATVEKELEAMAAMGVERVAFIDDTFNVPVRRFRELCRMMARRDFGLDWFSYFRCGNAREPEVYDLMREAGCRGVLLGLESGDDTVLKSMDKRATTDDYRFGIEQLKQRDIFVHASLVVGFPGETEDTVQRTIDFVNGTGPDTFAVNHWYYLHSTPIHGRAKSVDLVGSGHNWSHATMNSEQAIVAANRMFAEIVEAAWMPVNGLDFWGVPYLLGKELSAADVVKFLVCAKPLALINRLRDGAAANGVIKDAAAETAFGELCAGLPLSNARYVAAAALS